MNNIGEMKTFYDIEDQIQDLKKDLKHIGLQYGVRHQIKRAQSEIFELNEAILDYENAKDSIYTQDFDTLRTHVIEEYADVFNMLSQILIIYDIKFEELFHMMRVKADKQLNKMETIEEIKRIIDNL